MRFSEPGLEPQAARRAAEVYFVESTGSQAGNTTSDRLSISDRWAVKINCSSVLRLVCLAWLVPSVLLIWIGFGSVGLRAADRSSMMMLFDRVQATAMLLTIFGSLIGLIWALRVWTYLPSVGRISTPGGRFGPRSHLVSGLLALVPLTLAGLQQSARPALYAVAALFGFHACSLVGRWILRAPIGSPFPIAMLAFGAAFQVTLGWLHGAAWAEPLAPMLVFEGLLLTWMAIGAARAVSQVAVAESAVTQSALSKAEPSRVAVSEPDVGVVAGTELGAGADVEADAASKPTQAPALQPLPTPAVGH